jgi:predicted 2-oxoglutarate/Fe(II)-dependent dioxygenase YbiX
MIPSSKYYIKLNNAFSIDYLQHLKSQILTCSYLGDNQLNETFAGTRGFSVIFKTSSISEVNRQFPFFQTYLEAALKKSCNAFYLNPLVLKKGACVKPHIDCSLSSYSKEMLIPKLVSVLYVQVPNDLQGGELMLQENGYPICQIQPRVNTLLYFKGSLEHSVTEVESSQTRISLICEQYNLSETQLQSIPEFKIDTKAYRLANV